MLEQQTEGGKKNALNFFKAFLQMRFKILGYLFSLLLYQQSCFSNLITLGKLNSERFKRRHHALLIFCIQRFLLLLCLDDFGCFI
jgi:hypothetical protein